MIAEAILTHFNNNDLGYNDGYKLPENLRRFLKGRDILNKLP